MSDVLDIDYRISGLRVQPPRAYQRAVLVVWREAARRTILELRQGWPRKSGLSAAAFIDEIRRFDDVSVIVAVVNRVDYSGDVRQAGEQGVHAEIIEPMFGRHLDAVMLEHEAELSAAAESDALRSLVR